MGPHKKLLSLLFPPRCIFCRKITDGGSICKSCQGDLPVCGQIKNRGEFFSAAAAPLYYEGSVRKALHRYKFSGKRGYCVGFSELMADCVRRELSDRFDVVTWVPVSAKRLRKRGYDQSKLLAERTAERLGAPVVRALKKTRHTKANSTLEGRESRAANILGAYEVTQRELVAGKRVLLIDDIFTTGATMSECARMLLMAGAGDVVCAAVAAARRNNRKNQTYNWI